MRRGGGWRDAPAACALRGWLGAVAAGHVAAVGRASGLVRAVAMIAGGGLLAAGCTSGSPMLANASFGAAGFGATTVTFESIDGPPETVFKKLVSRLTEEASTRHVAVVSREAAAQYRIRGYVSAHVLGKRTTLAWVWDIYDAEGQRAQRLSGDVPGAAAERAWAAADETAISRMAHDSIERLAAFLAAPDAPPPAPSPEPAGPAVASVPSLSGALAYGP